MLPNDLELGQALFRKPRDVVREGFGGTLPTVQVDAEAVTDSEDGYFLAMVDADLFAADDLVQDADIDTPDGYALLEVPTSASVTAGDSVVLTVQGNKPTDAGNIGWGDRVNAAAAAAATLAQEAKDIADAIGQYAWNDANGTHVSTEEGVAEGTRNILLNSYGILLRAAANYLAALSQSGIAFYDGQGNAAANILASFGASGAQIGPEGQTHLLIDSDTVDVVDENGDTLMTMGYDTTFATAMMESPMGLTLRYVVDALSKQYAFLSLTDEDGAKAVSAAAVDLLNGQAELFATAGTAQSLIRLHSQHASYDAWLELVSGASDSAVNVTADTVSITGTTHHHGNIEFDNGNEMFGKTSGGTRQQMFGLNANDQFVLNYGGYANSNVPTNIEGNEIMLLSRGAINFRVGTAAAVDYAPTAWAYLVGSASGSHVRYCKRAGVVFVEVWYESGAAVGTTAKTLGTLPAGFRPSLQVETVAFGNVNNLAYLRVNPGGGIVAKSMSGTLNYFKGTISFPV